MQPGLKVGNTAEIQVEVTEDMCPAFDGIIVHRVYSTWSMAHHMELAARKVLAPHLDDHEEGIGSHLSIDHLAPCPVGGTVRVHAEAIHFRVQTHVHRKALVLACFCFPGGSGEYRGRVAGVPATASSPRGSRGGLKQLNSTQLNSNKQTGTGHGNAAFP